MKGKEAQVIHFNQIRKAADLVQLVVGRSYRVVLVWIVVSRGQCVAVGFIKAERRRGRDLRKSLAAVCSEVEGGLPGPAVVGGLLHHKLTGTRALWRGGTDEKNIFSFNSRTLHRVTIIKSFKQRRCWSSK